MEETVEIKKLGHVALTPRGEYESTSSYLPFSVVSYEGGSYMSKKDVPAGTPLSDTTCWMPIASRGAAFTYDDLTDAQKTELAKDAIAAAQQAAASASSVESLLNQVATSTDPDAALAAQVALNKQGVAENKEGLNDLAQKVDRVKRVNVVCSEKGSFFIDKDNNIGMQYTEEEGFDAALISRHFIKLLKDAGLGGGGAKLNGVFETTENGIFFVDSENNIGVEIVKSGIHAPNIVEFEII